MYVAQKFEKQKGPNTSPGGAPGERLGCAKTPSKNGSLWAAFRRNWTAAISAYQACKKVWNS